jgi:hypothetical protein
LRKRSWLFVSLAVIAVAAIVFRLTLPWFVESYVNRELARMGDYSGRVAEVSLALLRGAYTVHGLRIVKTGSQSDVPFLDLERMDVSLQWNALLNAELVGELVAQRPVLNLIQGETERETQLGTGVNWPEQVREFFPFNFNVVEVRDGTATFRAPGIEAEESLTIQNLQVVLRDLTNVQERQDAAFAEMHVAGGVMGNAPIRIDGRLDPNESMPTFDINMSIEGAELTDVNPWLEEFINVDAERGTFSMYAEVATSQGRFEGYIKPILENAEIFDMEEEASGPFRKAWEALVEIGANLFENREQDQIATEIPFAGEIENPEADMLATIMNLLRNAFVAAFSHSLEGTVGLDDVQIGENGSSGENGPSQQDREEQSGEERSGGEQGDAAQTDDRAAPADGS